jgi:hypothetical protein|uniref:Uncharacterized protein n=1 Tax=viral metagenome TaxID=1070528 RepID=A0A6C0D9T8_9ZZZZ
MDSSKLIQLGLSILFIIIVLTFVYNLMTDSNVKPEMNFPGPSIVPTGNIIDDDNMNELNSANQFPYTLEQEVVKKMAPIKTPIDSSPTNFSPILDDIHDAADVDYTGVV